jgi:hypothetical protein
MASGGFRLGGFDDRFAASPCHMKKATICFCKATRCAWTLPACRTVDKAGARRRSSVLAQPIRSVSASTFARRAAPDLFALLMHSLIVLNRLSKRRHGYDAPLTPIGRRLRRSGPRNRCRIGITSPPHDRINRSADTSGGFDDTRRARRSAISDFTTNVRSGHGGWRRCRRARDQ